MLKEFKEFALKGNMIDLAIGVIIGGAFNSLVTSLVENIIMPILSLVTGKIDFSNLFIALDGNTYKTLAAAQAAGASTVKYGLFFTGLLNFLIMAFVIFMIVKMMNKLRTKTEKPVEEIKEEKIILAIPLYTRVWTEDSSGKITSKNTVSMKNTYSVIPNGVEKQWNDSLKQYYVEYKDGNNTKKIWIEDETSLKEKISLIKKYKLGGVASWQKGMETDNFWGFLKNEIQD